MPQAHTDDEASTGPLRADQSRENLLTTEGKPIERESTTEGRPIERENRPLRADQYSERDRPLKANQETKTYRNKERERGRESVWMALCLCVCVCFGLCVERVFHVVLGVSVYLSVSQRNFFTGHLTWILFIPQNQRHKGVVFCLPFSHRGAWEDL